MPASLPGPDQGVDLGHVSVTELLRGLFELKRAGLTGTANAVLCLLSSSGLTRSRGDLLARWSSLSLLGRSSEDMRAAFQAGAKVSWTVRGE